MQIQNFYSVRARWIFTAIIAVISIYGMMMFPDAPINPCEQRYCGKLGSLHTEAEYQHFVIWAYIYVLVFMLTVVYSITWWVLEQNKKI